MPKLFTPLEIRGVRLRNRIAIAPMAQYCATDGCATDYHFSHLTAFATGGAALVFTESTKVLRSGLGSYGDLCLWNDDHVASLARITRFMRAAGAVPAMQLNHSGRKARSQRPWEGFGPLQGREEDLWPVVAPSALRHAEGWAMPTEMSIADIEDMIDAWVHSARLALAAGFQVLEIHGAHGYLVHQFLSPQANCRKDRYGGPLANRMRFALELTEAVRAAWPAELPLFFRVSATDDLGWTLDDTVTLARELKALGVDVVDCSSGGMTSRSPTASGGSRGLGYQVPYAAEVRCQAGIASMAVGLIVDAHQAEAILRAGDADVIAVGREALLDPYWPHHAAQALGADPGFGEWPQQYGWWLDRRRKSLAAPGSTGRMPAASPQLVNSTST
jgi:2,4-dienoyl-CoA reductase-like NADH-dependent reductase (Old Yellow Enzyme family)